MFRFNSLLSLALLAISVPLCSSAPITCATTASTLESLVTCLQAYTVPEDFYTCAGYSTAQPTATEITGWDNAVQGLLNAGGTCNLPVGSTITGSYAVSSFTDTSNGASYCVLSETNSNASGYFNRGWGYFIVPKTPNISTRTLHHSAPHPLADTNTPAQAVAIFKRTNSTSVLVAGRQRKALSSVGAGPSCSINSCVSSTYTKTDPAHDNSDPFHLALVGIHAWQNVGGCPLATCGYLQWHGKATTTCASDSIFLTSGLATGSCYSSATLPVNRIKTQLNTAFPTGTHSNPADSACTLTATQNVFGRLVNGVAPSSICSTAASPCGGTGFGQFVHLEQQLSYRSSANYNAWASAIIAAY